MFESDLSFFSPSLVLTTERLILRRLAVSDYRDMYEYSKMPETSRYLLWSPHETPRFTKKYLSYLQGQYRNGSFHDFAVVEKKSGKMIGTCGFTSFDLPNNSAEVGYVLSAPYWGQRIAPEALRAVITFGFEVLCLNRIEAHFMPDNHASRRVLEKCMMLPEGVRREAMYAKGRYIDIETYAITEKDYKKITNR